MIHRSAILIVLSVLAAGCGAPFGVEPSSPEEVHRSLNANVLSTGELSNPSQVALHRRNLTEAFEEDPEGTLAALHRQLREGKLGSDSLFILSELSFLHALDGGGQPYYLAAALYAYAFLFPADPESTFPPYDPRPRVAMDFYNRALTDAFEAGGPQEVRIAAGRYALPWGALEVTFDETQLVWGQRRLTTMVASAEYEVVGFENRYRQAGIGAPLAAATEPLDAEQPTADLVGPNIRVPVTAVLRIDQPRQQILKDEVTGTLEIYASSDVRAVEINGESIPLEQEPTAALGLTLTVAQPWARNLTAFLGKTLLIEEIPTFGSREPHRPGRIPVVFVHGTASNFSVWANMVNDLDADPVIRRNFEFWFFNYDSGQPVLYSGGKLREAITETITAFQAAGPDPCLEDVVVIGHSQGGLLTKLTAIDSGDTFWRGVSDKPFEEVDLSEENRELVRETLFVEPLPPVKRVVFIATPQRGSYLASPGIVRRLAQRMVTLPAAVVRGGAELLASDEIREHTGMSSIPTSIDNMSPGHPFIVSIAKIPVSPDVAAHSIIGVTGDGPVDEGDDGVVEYTSAHLDGVESELVVPYGHSMQAEPEVVSEVQRILRHHLELSACKREGDAEPRAPGAPGL